MADPILLIRQIKNLGQSISQYHYIGTLSASGYFKPRDCADSSWSASFLEINNERCNLCIVIQDKTHKSCKKVVFAKSTLAAAEFLYDNDIFDESINIFKVATLATTDTYIDTEPL